MRCSVLRAAKRTLSLSVVTSATLLGCVAASATTGLELGRPAPAFVLPDTNGKDVTLTAFAGRPLAINVFASWCPPCRQELPRIVAAARATRGHVAFLGVDEQEPRSMAMAFVRDMRLPYRIVFDHGQFAASYGAQSLPETVFIDARGRVVAIVHGAIAARDLAADLAQMQTP